MSNQNESFVTLTENNSMMETKASFTESGYNDVNSLLEEYEKICQTFDEIDNEKIENLSDILEKLKLQDTNNNTLGDLITEIENKLILGKQILENPEDSKEKLEKLKEASDFHRNNWTYSTYNKYLDKEDEEDEIPKMSKKFFNKFLCSNYRLYYRTHELNDILYLHYKSFRKIENLETFINLKVLYLEGNSIKKIDGLNHLKQLSCIYLQENCIEKIENLEGLDKLYNLNLSDNCIEKIENLSSLKSLSNLLLKRNRIGINDNADLEGLTELPKSVTVLDISDNRIEITDYIQDKLTKISNLRVLYNHGNESVRKIPHYRKYLINTLKQLHYLDDKPVFEDERRHAEAFGRGGLEEERRERALIKKEKEDYEIKRMKDFRELVENWKKEKDNGNGEKLDEENSANNESKEKESEEEAKKKREEAKKKLLNKVKGKKNEKNNEKDQGNMLSITEGDIPEEDFMKNDENKLDITPLELIHEKKKIVEKPSNDIFNDYDEDEQMPSLEDVKHKKQEEYIDYILEKNQYETANEDLKSQIKKEEIELGEKEEIVDTSHSVKKSDDYTGNVEERIKCNQFDELD